MFWDVLGTCPRRKEMSDWSDLLGDCEMRR